VSKFVSKGERKRGGVTVITRTSARESVCCVRGRTREREGWRKRDLVRGRMRERDRDRHVVRVNYRSLLQKSPTRNIGLFCRALLQKRPRKCASEIEIDK